MKRKLSIVCACSAIIASILCMSGCVDQVADGMDQAGQFLRDNKEPIESGLNELQNGIVDASDKLNDFLHDQQTATSTRAPGPNVEIVTSETTKGMKY